MGVADLLLRLNPKQIREFYSPRFEFKVFSFILAQFKIVMINRMLLPESAGIKHPLIVSKAIYKNTRAT